MFLTTRKIATAVLVLATLACCGAGMLTITASAGVPTEPATKVEARQGKPVEDANRNTVTIHARLAEVDAVSNTITAIDVTEKVTLDALLEKFGKGEIRIEKLKPYLEEEVSRFFVQLPARYSIGLVEKARKQVKLTNPPLAKGTKIMDGTKEIQVTNLRAGMLVTLQLTVGQRGLTVAGVQIYSTGGRQKAEEKMP